MASFKASDSFLFIFRAVDLGKSVCQDMWNRTGNNLKIPLELEVASNESFASNGSSVLLFQVKQPEGKTKTRQPVFVKFHGD